MTEIRRPLSAVERWYWLCDQFSTLNVISRVRVRGDLRIDDVRRGLDALQARHPLLRTAIEHDDGLRPRWVPSNHPIPLRRVHRERDDQWVSEIDDRELVQRVDTDVGPLIRTTVVSGSDGTHDLLIVVPHIIADGTTVLSLAEQLLSLSLDPAVQQTISRVLAPAEELRPLQYTGDEGQARLTRQTANDEELLGRLRPGRVEPSVVVPLEERRTRLLHRVLSGEQMDAVYREAKKHGTTVHGALTAALVLAASRDAAKQSNYFAVGSPIDFRGELAPPVQHDEVGTYVATVPSVVDVSLPFWDLAREITTDLTERKSRGYHFNLMTMVVGAAPHSKSDARPFMQYMEAEGPINLCSSNIGRYAFPSQVGACEISDAQFLTGISVNGYFVATINSSHGRLFWNFTYIDRAISTERAERMANTCIRTLLSAVTNDVPANVQGTSNDPE